MFNHTERWVQSLYFQFLHSLQSHNCSPKLLSQKSFNSLRSNGWSHSQHTRSRWKRSRCTIFGGKILVATRSRVMTRRSWSSRRGLDHDRWRSSTLAKRRGPTRKHVSRTYGRMYTDGQTDGRTDGSPTSHHPQLASDWFHHSRIMCCCGIPRWGLSLLPPESPDSHRCEAWLLTGMHRAARSLAHSLATKSGMKNPSGSLFRSSIRGKFLFSRPNF